MTTDKTTATPKKKTTTPAAPSTPLKAIRAKCLDCSGGNATEARKCVHKACVLYPFRMGHKPTTGKKKD